MVDKYKKIIFKILISLFLIIVAVFTAATILINVLTYSLAEKIVEDYTGLKIEFIQPKSYISSSFNINLKAKKINLYNKNKTTKYITIDTPNITFKPFSILVKKINIKKADISNISINLKKDKEGNIDFFNDIKIKNNIDFENYTLSRLCGKINKITISVENKENLNEKNILILNNLNTKISKRKNSIAISGSGFIENYKNNIKNISNLDIDISTKFKPSDSKDNIFNININNLKLDLLSDVLKKYISSDIKNLSGTLDFSIKSNNNASNKLTAQIYSPVLIYKDKTIDGYKDGIKLESDFKINKSIVLDNFNLSAKNLLLKINGQIDKPFSKKPDINFEIETKNTQINNLVYLLPDNLIYYRPKGIPVLKNSNFYGIADGKINLKLFPLNITGSMKFSDVHIPEYPKPYKQNDVNAVFMNNKVRIYTRVYTPENEYVLIDGVSNLDNSLWGKYSVKSTSKIDLSFAKMYLVPIQQIIGFNIGPVPIMDISGYGNIDIKTQGTVKDAQIFGEFNAYNASAQINGLDVKLKNGICKLVFDNRNLIFKEIKGKAQESDFILTGIGNTKGEVDLKAQLLNIRAYNLLNILKNSEATKKYTVLAKEISAVSGLMNAEINLKGTINDYEDYNFLSNLSHSGSLEFKNVKAILNNKLQAQKINGNVKFGNFQKGILSLFINNSKVNAEFESKDSIEKITSGSNFSIKTQLSSNKFEFADILNEIKKVSNILPIDSENLNFISKFNIKSEATINLKELNLENLKNSGFIIGLNSSKNKNIHFDSGLIKLDGNKVIFDNFILSMLGGKLKIKGSILKPLSKHPNFNTDIYLEDSNFENVTISKLKLNNAKIKKAHIEARNNSVKFNPITLEYEGTPLYIKAGINDIYGSKTLEANFTTIANETMNDGIINRFLTSPVKIKGEIPLKGYFKGRNDDYTLDFTASIPENSDIFFSGANIGDENLKRELAGKIIVKNNIAELNNLKLVKYISNQNGKINPLTSLKIAGKIIQKESELFYDNVRISTSSPVNVRILNVLFKKSLLKKGNIECNVTLNGNSVSPKIQGTAYLQDLDMPLYNTLIDNIKLHMTNDYINGEAFAKNNTNDLKLTVKAKNNQQPPYIVENIDISSNKLDILEVLNNLPSNTPKTDIDVKQGNTLKISDLIIKNGGFKFKDVNFEGIKAENLEGKFSYKDSLFDLRNVVFNLAEGIINATGNYNTKTTELKLKANMEDCNSNILTEEILHMKGQLYGKIDGSVNLEAKSLTGINAIKNIKSEVIFNINNGKMPKLGSLEYILRAGNLVRNGLFGLSLNNVIQVLTPYKTGEFETISGNVLINKGEIKELNITSKSKNLSMYLEGTYNILDAAADIRIYGKLSSNISNALGAIGNASMGQFIDSITSKKSGIDKDLKEKLDKIPTIEIEKPEPKYFKVKVLGDINKENYVKNFSWI